MSSPAVELRQSHPPGLDFAKLSNLVRLSTSGAFAVVLYDQPNTPLPMTRQIANAAGLPVLDMALSPDVHDPLAYATQLTPEQRQQRIVVCVRGLDNLLPLHENGQPTQPERWPEVQTQVARTLDLRRDWLGHMPHVFLVWATAPMLGVLREFAPNFMSQARGVFDLRDLDDTQTQLPERSLERLPHGEVSVPDADTLRREWALVTEQLAALKGENKIGRAHV